MTDRRSNQDSFDSTPFNTYHNQVRNKASDVYNHTDLAQQRIKGKLSSQNRDAALPIR